MQSTHEIASAVKDSAAVGAAGATIYAIPLATINLWIQVVGGLLSIAFILYRFWKLSHQVRSSRAEPGEDDA